MQDKKRELEELIKKYSEGIITDLERAHLMQWMRELNLLKEDKPDIEHSYHKMKKQIDARLMLPEPNDKQYNSSWQFYGLLAAALIFCLSFGWFLLDGIRLDEPSKARYSSIEKSIIKPLKMVCTVSNDSLVLLEDGTRVRLLANSTMTWTQPFPYDRRDIHLKGKAFFEVAHDKKRPFTVLSSNILTTALGTSFWVEQDSKNAKPKVRLVTGRVSIKERRKNGEEILLAFLIPGQIWKETAISPKQQYNPVEEEKIITPLVGSTLTFHHKPLSEVLTALAVLYQTTICFSSEEVSGLSFYGTYTQNDNITQILNTICLANDLEFTFDSAINSYKIIKKHQ